MLLKQKRDGSIQGRHGGADEYKKRVYMIKGVTSFPTIAIESVMHICTIEAQEGRDVTTVDIPGPAYMLI
jgi:hypothetical protein